MPYAPLAPPKNAVSPSAHPALAVAEDPSLHTVGVVACHVPFVGALVVPLEPSQYLLAAETDPVRRINAVTAAVRRKMEVNLLGQAENRHPVNSRRYGCSSESIPWAW